MPLDAGQNDLVVTVTDVSGNQSQQTRHVTKNCLEAFGYDNNGNLTNWVNGSQIWSYQWDSNDRLTKVISNSVMVLENFYNTSAQRAAKKEIINGQTNYTLYISDGLEIIGVANQNGQILETFTRGIGMTGDVGTLIAVTHHSGSPITPGTYYTHCNHRGDIVLTRNGATTVGAYTYSAFGNLNSAVGPDVCRFKFSSKECDTTTGLSYYGYRFYMSQWQRWANQDFIKEITDLSTIEDFEEVANLFQFNKNCPISMADSFGLAPKKIPPDKYKKLPNPYRLGPNCKEWGNDCKNGALDQVKVADCAKCCEEQFVIDEARNPKNGIKNAFRKRSCQDQCILSGGEKGPR